MLIVSSDSDDRRLLDSSEESDASDDINDSDEIDASDNIDVALNFFCLSIGDTKGRCLVIGKGRNFKSLFFDAERRHCHCDVSNMHKWTLFFDGTETVACMFICASKEENELRFRNNASRRQVSSLSSEQENRVCRHGKGEDASSPFKPIRAKRVRGLSYSAAHGDSMPE